MVRLGNTQEEPARADDLANGSALPRVAAFGPYQLHATARVLQKAGVALKIGSRALDILVTLVESAPEVVTKRDLISRVWGKLVVHESSLRWHIASLRKTLRDDESGARYVKNVVGRGYCFAAPVTWTTAAPTASESVATPLSARLPGRPFRMVGRDGAVRELTRRLREQRFVSIVGAGGIGKTTVALAVAHEVLPEFAGGIHFLDLAAIENPQLVAGVLASQLGLSVVSENPLPAILAFLHERRALLVFDSCEGVIETTAALAESIFRDAPQVHVLATSRESLRVEGERVHHLSPLECPPADAVSLTATQALAFPAVQLFVEQAAASGYRFELNDEDAPAVAEVCRRLDGIALALELAACRVGVYGVQGIASLLENEFGLLWRGRRTALLRHQTLNATLDWSYNLLSETERLTLRRLAVFVGAFSLEASLDVVAHDLDPSEVTETFATLVDKSLVALVTTAPMRYRLLDTTRAYASQKLAESGEHATIARRHGEYFSSRLERFKASAALASSPEAINFFVEYLGNVRAALVWSFSELGDSQIGVRLTAASAPLFYQLTLLTECIAWADRAMRDLDSVSRGTRLELELQACFGFALIYNKGNIRAAHSALVRALELAESLEDAPSQLLLLCGLYRFEIRSGDFRGLVALSGRCEAAAKQIEGPVADGIANAIAAMTCCYLGRYKEALFHARIAFALPIHDSRLNPVTYGYVHSDSARNVLSRSLWMLGYADQAIESARQSLDEATDLGNPLTIAYALDWNVFLYLQTGDWLTAAKLLDRLMNYAKKDDLSIFYPQAVGCQGILAILRGDPSQGIEALQTALAARAFGQELHRSVFSAPLAQGFLKAGRIELARTTICEAVTWAENHGRSAEMPELLRIKAGILIAMSPANTSEAEVCLASSLELARQQSALALELRTGMSLAQLWAENGKADEALGLLAPIHSRFTEGFHTSDLVAAANLLDELHHKVMTRS
jgi:predicted ATPase/DNA-binding winged helix-turn-helix (wHTH) protein